MRERLRLVILTAVDDPRPRREIQRYATLATSIANPDLRAQLEQLIQQKSHHTAVNLMFESPPGVSIVFKFH
jgi:hypothetical protein